MKVVEKRVGTNEEECIWMRRPQRKRIWLRWQGRREIERTADAKEKEIYGDAMDGEKKARENGKEANMGMEMMMLLETPSDFEVGKREEEARQGRAMDK